MDFILNGQASGNVAQVLLANNMNPNVLRPYLGRDGHTYMTVNENGKAKAVRVDNANATLRKDDWKLLDTAIIKAAKPRLKAVGMLRAAGLQHIIPNGMSKTVLEYERQSDISDAEISMDGLRDSQADRVVYDSGNLPLPIIHKDFQFSARQLMNSRNGGSPLDTTMGELAGRKVAEQAEQLLLGTASSFTYGGGTVYGYTNFPSRLTKTMTAPTSANHATTLAEVLAMKAQAVAAYHYGPFFCFCSSSWDQFMDEDYSTAYPGLTLRERIGKIEGVDAPVTLDYLPAKTLVLVQKTSDVAREVVGMDITTVQWETHGGLQVNFKVMAILVPQLRADINSNTGIVHGTHP